MLLKLPFWSVFLWTSSLTFSLAPSSILLIFSGYITLSLPLSFPISIHLSHLRSLLPFSLSLVFPFRPLPLTSSLSPDISKLTLSSSTHSLRQSVCIFISRPTPVSLIPSLPSASMHILLWTLSSPVLVFPTQSVLRFLPQFCIFVLFSLSYIDSWLKTH